MSKIIDSDVSSKQKSFKSLSLNDENTILVPRDFKGLLIGSKKNVVASALFNQKKG